MEIALCILIGLFGVLIGIFVARLKLKSSKPVGTLIIAKSDQDGPYAFLELSTNITDISKKKKIVLEITNVNYLPHE